MLNTVATAALVLSFLNWALFVFITFLNDLPLVEAFIQRVAAKATAGVAKAVPKGLAHVELQGLDPKKAFEALDPKKVADATGSLAGAFKKAGAGPTAAAMSLICLVIAAVAAGLEKL